MLLTVVAIVFFNSPLVIVLYVLAVPSILCFLYVEAKQAKNPIVPSYLWRNRNVVTLLSINVFMGMTFWTLIFYLPMYFQVRLSSIIAARLF